MIGDGGSKLANLAEDGESGMSRAVGEEQKLRADVGESVTNAGQDLWKSRKSKSVRGTTLAPVLGDTYSPRM